MTEHERSLDHKTLLAQKNKENPVSYKWEPTVAKRIFTICLKPTSLLSYNCCERWNAQQVAIVLFCVKWELFWLTQ